MTYRQNLIEICKSFLLIVIINVLIYLALAEVEPNPNEGYIDELIKRANELGTKLQIDSAHLEKTMIEELEKVTKWDKLYKEGKNNCELMVQLWQPKFLKIMKKIEKLGADENLKGFPKYKKELIMDITDRVDKSEDFLETFDSMSLSANRLKASALKEISLHGGILAEFLMRRDAIEKVTQNKNENIDEDQKKDLDERTKELASLTDLHKLVIGTYEKVDGHFKKIEDKIEKMDKGTGKCKDRIDAIKSIQDFIEQVDTTSDMKKVSNIIFEVLEEEKGVYGEHKYPDPTKLFKEHIDKLKIEL